MGGLEATQKAYDLLPAGQDRDGAKNLLQHDLEMVQSSSLPEDLLFLAGSGNHCPGYIAKRMKQKINQLIANPRNIILLYALFAVAASVQSVAAGKKTYLEGGREYNHYNNYTIFKESFFHLKNDQDLYILYPEEHWDLYKYTPTFSVFFGLFAVTPDWLGLSLWNLLNALVLLFAVYYLPRLGNREKGLILLIALIELMTSMQNAQSNALIAGLLILAFGLLEKRNYSLAALSIVGTAFIKLFGIVGFALFIFYPQKWKLTLYTVLWTAALFVVPLAVVDYEQYMALLDSYRRMLAEDHSLSYGYSVMGWLHSWFSVSISKNMVVLAGVALFLLPLANLKAYKELGFRYLLLASVLIWVVIFNHKAESPTFVIAMAGVALWYVNSEKNVLNTVLFIGAFVLTSLSPTDIFPRPIREEWVKPYVLKAVPCILVWVKVLYDMATWRAGGERGNDLGTAL